MIDYLNHTSIAFQPFQTYHDDNDKDDFLHDILAH